MIGRYGIEYCDVCWKRKAASYYKVRKAILCSLECANEIIKKCDDAIAAIEQQIEDNNNKPAWVYILEDENRVAHYVGCTTNPKSRERSHKSTTIPKLGIKLKFVIKEECRRVNMFQKESEWYASLIAKGAPLKQSPVSSLYPHSNLHYELNDWVNYRRDLLQVQNEPIQLSQPENWLDLRVLGDYEGDCKKALELGFPVNFLSTIRYWHSEELIYG